MSKKEIAQKAIDLLDSQIKQDTAEPPVKIVVSGRLVERRPIVFLTFKHYSENVNLSGGVTPTARLQNRT